MALVTVMAFHSHHVCLQHQQHIDVSRTQLSVPLLMPLQGFLTTHQIRCKFPSLAGYPPHAQLHLPSHPQPSPLLVEKSWVCGWFLNAEHGLLQPVHSLRWSPP
ncbi:hypothetical protein P7K49_039834 [Saguinus oedipus]|uniref:Uncharacterized protein n=1 Tax=Saguinus oedipus TaxID=9490 RepID=A0ABQ9TAV5_SAGOE|nr:hypothetical protein P7K49_039834 [Saguinus oedipus]